MVWNSSRDQLFPALILPLRLHARIVIDGNINLRPWGSTSFQLEPGMHQVRIYFHYLFLPQCGPAAINVVVQPNCVHRIKYEMGIFMFSTGSIREVTPPFRFGR